MIDPQGEGAYGVTYGPIWGNPTAPIIEIDLENIDEGLGLPCDDCNRPANRATCWWCVGHSVGIVHYPWREGGINSVMAEAPDSPHPVFTNEVLIPSEYSDEDKAQMRLH